MLTDQEFQLRSSQTLQQLYDDLSDAADDYDFDVDFGSGALRLEFETPPGKMVVSPNSPVKQIWVSAHVKSYKFDWSDDEKTFVLPDSGQTLRELMSEAISKQLGKEIDL